MLKVSNCLIPKSIYTAQSALCLLESRSEQKKVLRNSTSFYSIMYTHIYVECNNATVTIACICLNIVFIHTALILSKQPLQCDPLFWQPSLYLAAPVETWGVLCGKQHELGVGLHGLLCLRDKQLPVVIQQLYQQRTYIFSHIWGHLLMIGKGISNHFPSPLK